MSTAASDYAPFSATAARPSASTPSKHKDTQLLARLMGLFFIITFAASIPPFVAYYVPALSSPASCWMRLLDQ